MNVLEGISKKICVKNVRPSGFNIQISSEGKNINKVSKTIDKALIGSLESIYTEFTRELKFLPPIVLAKSKKIEPAPSKPNNIRYTFNFLGFFAVRLGKKADLTKKFNISMKESWTGTDFTPEFLLDYDSGEPSDSDKFSIYEVSFEIQFSVAPRSITTFIWDQDPEGSRGTETSVQSGG